MFFCSLEAWRSFLQNTNIWMRQPLYHGKILSTSVKIYVYVARVFGFWLFGFFSLLLLKISVHMLNGCNFNFSSRFSYKITPYWIWYSPELQQPDRAFPAIPATSCFGVAGSQPVIDGWESRGQSQVVKHKEKTTASTEKRARWGWWL